MYVPRSQAEQRYALDGAATEIESRPAPQKWSARKSLVFVTAASSFLWVLIIYAAIQLL